MTEGQRFFAWAVAIFAAVGATMYACSAKAAEIVVRVTPIQRAQIATAIRENGNMPCVSVVNVTVHDFRGGKVFRIDCGGHLYRATLRPLTLERW